MRGFWLNKSDEFFFLLQHNHLDIGIIIKFVSTYHETDIVLTVPKISNSASVYNVFISFGWTRLEMRRAQQSVRTDNNVPTVLDREPPSHGIHLKEKNKTKEMAKPRKTMSAINRERVNARTVDKWSRTKKEQPFNDRMSRRPVHSVGVLR